MQNNIVESDIIEFWAAEWSASYCIVQVWAKVQECEWRTSSSTERVWDGSENVCGLWMYSSARINALLWSNADQTVCVRHTTTRRAISDQFAETRKLKSVWQILLLLYVLKSTGQDGAYLLLKHNPLWRASTTLTVLVNINVYTISCSKGGRLC